jgi:hypothetical protein
LYLPLGLAHGPAIDEDRPDRLLTEGVVRGDVQDLTGGVRLSIAELVNEELASGPCEERANDVRVNDVRERVALPREPMNVVS